METVEKLFRQAVQTYQKGERDHARELMRKVLIENPRYAPGWLWMSAFVDDVKQRRECLNRTLELDPTNEHARKGLEILRMQELMAAAPPPAPETAHHDPDPGQRQARKLGDYLIDQGLINMPQLERALMEQKNIRSSFQGARMPIGDVLIRLGFLTPEKLAHVLLDQQEDKIGTTTSPEYLGEYLVSTGIVSRKQLEAVLAEQIRLRQSGRRMLLGDLLIRAGYITAGALESVLDQQRNDVFNRFMLDGADEE